MTLGTVFRQSGQSPEQIAFRDALLRLRTYDTSQEDYNLFATRFWDVLPAGTRSEFQTVLHLLPTRAAVEEVNLAQLSALAKPVVRCKAKHNCVEAKKASEEDADGLEKEVLLAEGARVMVTRNIWTSKGLVNGTQGTVKKILYMPTSRPRDGALPAVVFVECEDYTG